MAEMMRGLKDKLRPYIGQGARRSFVARSRDRLNAMILERRFLPLHRKFLECLDRQYQQWPHLNYGTGYFYQGWSKVGIHGQRSTDLRVRDYRFKELLGSDMVLLDIGANSGFVALAAAEFVKHVDAVEYNPFQCEIGQHAAEFLNIGNIEFHACEYWDFKPSHRYDVIISLASHHTLDGNMNEPLEHFFKDLHCKLEPDGVLLFESHPYDLGSAAFEDGVESAQRYFVIESKELLTKERTQEQDRLYYVMRRK